MNTTVQIFLWYMVAVQVVAAFVGIVDSDEHGFAAPYVGVNMLCLGAFLLVFSLSKMIYLMMR